MTSSSDLTYTGVAVAVFANQICLPIPSVLFLMAAGALSAQGKMWASLILLLSVIASVMADWIWFWLGRRWGSQTIRVLSRFAADPRRSAANAHRHFQRYGPPLLCFAKFFPGLDGILPPLVGAEGVSVISFLILDTVGSLLWSACYVGLGYAFSNRLEPAIAWTEHFGTALAVAIGVAVILYAGWRAMTLWQMIRRLQVRQISPAMLDRKLKSKSKVAVLDLLDFELETGDSPVAIPSAMRVDPTRLRNTSRITVPPDVDVVLYSSSGRDSVAARAAVGLSKIGIDNVWVLEGGLKAWRARGLPVAKAPELPEVVAARLGVKLPEQ